MFKKKECYNPTMTFQIKSCIEKKPTVLDIDSDHPNKNLCIKLINLLVSGNVDKCLPLWRKLNPKVSEDTISFKVSDYKEKKQNGFYNEISSFGFSESLVVEAVKIHDQFEKIIKKKENRFFLFFQCIYYAHLILKIASPPEIIAQKMSLPPEITKKSFVINPIHYNLITPEPFTPYDYLVNLLEEFLISKDLANIISIPMRKFMEENPISMNIIKPQILAIAAIMLFAENEGMSNIEGIEGIKLIKSDASKLKSIKSILARY